MQDLTTMHVNWLSAKDKPLKKKKKSSKRNENVSKTQLVSQDHQETMSVVDDQTNTLAHPVNETYFGLRSTNLFVTDNPWSTEEHYLSAIRTDSKNDAIEDVARLCRGSLSIKPQSVINALEFYLGKDVYQKALAARLRYVEDHKKDWVKIKRGKDRILVKEEKLDDEQFRMVFFVEGRDQVYRDLNR